MMRAGMARLRLKCWREIEAQALMYDAESASRNSLSLSAAAGKMGLGQESEKRVRSPRPRQIRRHVMPTTRRMLSVFTLFAVPLALSLSHAATGEADDPREAKPAAAAEARGPEVGEVRIRTLAPRTYAYVETETTFTELGNAIGDAMGKVQKVVEDGTIKVDGPFVLAYPKGSAHRTPDKPFQLHIGLMVKDESKGGGDVKVRKTEPFKA